MALNGYFIQYKFIIPDSVKHSSYTYQKLFRALYGYTQNVSKSSGKTYRYHRKGVLSEVPYIRPGKNCVIIPPEGFNQLINFFKTGKNPSHYWRGKGDWKAVYYMDEKTLNEDEVISSLEELLGRNYVLTTSEEHQKLNAEIENILNKASSGAKVDEAYKKLLLAEADRIISNTWFRECHNKSPKLSAFVKKYKALKGA